MSLILEVCIESAESAIAAEAGGANRVELCDNLMEGGTTPSAGMVALTMEKVDIDVMMMIRPRGGDFLYTDLEFEIMLRDIEEAKRLGVHGVVFGLLTHDGKIDKERTATLIEAARPMKVTVHRAFDMTVDPFEALEDLISLGVDRLLSSGQEPSTDKGIPLLTKLVEQAGDRMIILPGCGINESNIAELVSETGVNECHVTGKHQIPSQMTYTNPRVFMGVPGAPEYEKTVVDPERIRALRTAAEER
jgi:copper homeostasis protein